MNLLGIGTIIDTVGKIADDLITTDEERLQLYIEKTKIEAGLIEKIHNTNIEEARHPSIFVAGWRPAIGWIGAICIGYQFILYPLLTWMWTLLQAWGKIPPGTNPPPVLKSDMLWTIITGMLGIAGLRTYDKIKKVDTKKIKN